MLSFNPLHGVTVNSKDSSAFQYFSSRTSCYFIAKNLILSYSYRPPFHLCLPRVSFNTSARQLQKRSVLRGFLSRGTIYLTFNLAAGLRSSAGPCQFLHLFSRTRVRTIAGIDKIHLTSYNTLYTTAEQEGKGFSIFRHPRRCHVHIS